MAPKNHEPLREFAAVRATHIAALAHCRFVNDMKYDMEDDRHLELVRGGDNV